MEKYILEAESRTVIGKKVKTIRNAGLVPGTIYGPKTDPMSVQFVYRPLQVALMKAGGTQIIDIEVDGKTYPSLARDVQRDILKGDILHVDFLAVDMSAKITAEIPINLINESPVVSSREGILITGPNSLTVETLPSNLVDHIDIDLSTLTEIGADILVKHLDLGEETEILNDPEEMIAKVVQTSAARAEFLEGELEGEAEDDMMTSAEPEVISKGKEEEE